MSQRPSAGKHLGSNPAKAIANDQAQLSRCQCWHLEENLGDDGVLNAVSFAAQAFAASASRSRESPLEAIAWCGVKRVLR